MKVEEFKKLYPRRQRQLVVERGVPLGKRESQRFSIYLYGLHGFYVEVYFFNESGEYSTLRPFEEVDKLAPYLQQIDIQELLPQ
jgi:hypothetical protein